MRMQDACQKTPCPGLRELPRKIEFIDQTLETARYYEEGHLENDSPEPARKSLPVPECEVPIDCDIRPSQVLPPRPISTDTWRPSTREAHGDIGHSSASNGQAIFQSEHGPVHSMKPSSKEKGDADLVRQFIDKIGPSLDPWDESRRFAADLVEAAFAWPCLMKSILLVSGAKSNIKDCDQGAKQRNEHQRIELEEGDAVQDQPAYSIVTATKLLYRTRQNLNNSVTKDAGEVLLSRVCASARSIGYIHLIPGSLEEKTIWAVLWQELYIAIMHQTPLPPGSDEHLLHELTSGGDDRTWTNRMLLHLFNTVRYCFSEERSTATYDRLVSYSATWMESKPSSFDPVFIRISRDAMFPHISLLNDVVAAGLQYYHLVRILLLAHNPRLPLLGAAQKTAKQRGDALIQEDVKIICGIAESLDHVHPAHLTSCIAISLVGDRFTKHEDQVQLLQILSKTNQKFGWSVAYTESYLKETWEWEGG
ncbi:hypothetical protein HIM_06278 [Hirsutella minnesotensis 3608]|uniref:Transcription factor domain-containing protein n=1 Tax=Hirsutella minnesotensis 3608 TaxID=1043627 RepID=A0A0F7ZZI3_9HYPO|nr:hypothetical protein HIM_06278 [Hirsutella minnesotensis 3608]